ncbi:hypothetical protein JQ571_30725 [Bradyrhizobium liaoningense]|nr:hypothetical protein [Bradyrhizobium liaoningense]
MASQSQIAANRRNSRKSTGPRSRAGKKRSSGNALRHGLSISFHAGAVQTKAIEKLAQQMAGPRPDRIALELARAAASAVFDLARVRQVKTQLIKAVSALGSVDPSPTFTSRRGDLRYLKLALKSSVSPAARSDPSATMPSEEVAGDTEAVRRALPELEKLDRYEARAINRRDRAIRAMISSWSDAPSAT